MKPLQSLHVVEFAGLGPAPFAAMLLSDLGARVTRITRGPNQSPTAGAFTDRGRHDLALDLKSETGRDQARALIAKADVLIEGLRPGKMEALGLGPADLANINPALIYARMTGWGQTGPMAHMAGHDINYLAMTGMLSLLGEEGKPPPPPLNLVADFGGGGMYLAMGILAAVMQARETGQGQIIDAAMVHGVTHLSSFVHEWIAAERWSGPRGGNLLDGGAPFYRCYACADGRHIAVGALESQFFAALIDTLELQGFADRQNDRSAWPEMAAALAATFAGHPLDHWVSKFAQVDACVSPVLTVDEAKEHPQMATAFENHDGFVQPTPAPRFSPLKA